MEHTVSIEKIIHGGHGLARLENGMVVLVPSVLASEKVLVRETKKQRGYILAEAVAILEPALNRIDPPCPYHDSCGGCDLQHMDISAQQQAKVEIIKESLLRAKVPFTEYVIRQIVPSPDPYHYRYRIRLQVSPAGKIGFYRVQSNEVVEISHCLVATERINTALEDIRKNGFPPKILDQVSEIELLHSPADDKLFCILTSRNKKTLHVTNQDIFPALGTIDGLVTKQNQQGPINVEQKEKFLRQDFPESDCGRPYTLEWTPGCFSQVNATQNINLVRLICQLLGTVTEKRILDLFCGMGNFSIPLALSGAEVTGVERNTESIRQANRNAQHLGLTNIIFHDRNVDKWLVKAVKKRKNFDSIILDPPRQGLGKSIGILNDLSPEKIVYISCDPATLARDLTELCRHGFKITTVNPVDMFPQTHHIESVVLLEKN